MRMTSAIRFACAIGLAFPVIILAARFGDAAERVLLPHPDDATKKVEVFWGKPPGPGPFPAILFIHGHQFPNRPGAKIYLNFGRLGRMVAGGYVVAAVSQPGYGASDGPPDFCGPYTQKAVLAAIAFLRAKRFVKKDKVALYGYSRGAIVAGMVAARDARLAAVILGAGMYDLERDYPTGLRGLDDNLRRETKGASKAALRARSAFQHADRIKAAVLLLHGADDDRFRPDTARRLAERLRAHGVPVTLKIFPRVGHSIPIRMRYRHVYAFLGRHVAPIRNQGKHRFRESGVRKPREGPVD